MNKRLRFGCGAALQSRLAQWQRKTVKGKQPVLTGKQLNYADVISGNDNGHNKR